MTTPIYCTRCGVSNAASHLFCNACGARLQAGPALQPAVPRSFADRIWTWIRRRSPITQTLLWFGCWWLLLPLLIWRTSWNTWLKAALTAPFALIIISALAQDPASPAQTTARQVALAPTQIATALVQDSPVPTGVSIQPTAEPTGVPPTSAPPTPPPPTATIPPTNTPIARVATLTTTGNLRAYPSTASGEIVGAVASGDGVTLLSKTPDGAWYQVETSSGQRGYMSASLLRTSPDVVAVIPARDPGPAPVVIRPTARPAPAAAPATGVRVGAICRDGTRSNATGRGACSHHGGVDHWLYQ